MVEEIGKIDIEKNKKPFWRRFLWLWIIICIGILSIIVLSFVISKNTNGNSKDSSIDKFSNKEEDPSLSSGLPACPADTSQLFTKAFMDEGKPDYIIPLGNSQQSGHVVPVDHVYPQMYTYVPNTPVYAPGDMTLVWIENKQIYYTATNEKVMPDYQLNFAPCRGLNLSFIHLTSISDKIKNAITEPVDSNCGGEKMDYGTRYGQSIYYQTCHPNFEKISIKAGELLGSFGFSDPSGKSPSGFDIGMYDFNRPALSFISPERYYDFTIHTSCFADYYTPELKAKYEVKFGGLVSQGSDVQTFLQRKVNPVCGKIMWDLPGTAQGDWFKNAIERENITDNEALVLIHDNLQPEMAKMSWANLTSYLFTPTHSGTTNRQFSEVTADGKIYCYQSTDDPKPEQSRPANNSIKYLLQLTDDTHLKAEQQTGVCGASERFQNPTNFMR